jgi:hypothetical protein
MALHEQRVKVRLQELRLRFVVLDFRHVRVSSG